MFPRGYGLLHIASGLSHWSRWIVEVSEVEIALFVMAFQPPPLGGMPMMPRMGEVPPRGPPPGMMLCMPPPLQPMSMAPTSVMSPFMPGQIPGKEVQLTVV